MKLIFIVYLVFSMADLAEVVKPAPQEAGVMDDRDLKLRLLLQTLMDPELNLKRQAEGDPWTYRDKNFRVQLYKDIERMRGDISKTQPDPQLFRSFMGSLKKGGKQSIAGWYDGKSKTIFSPYEKDALEHELRHHFYPEEKHPLYETLDEYKARKGTSR